MRRSRKPVWAISPSGVRIPPSPLNRAISRKNASPDRMPTPLVHRMTDRGLNLSYRESTMAKRIWLEQLQELVDRGAQVVEVLPADDYAPAHLPGAVNLPLRELDERHAAVLDRTRPVVVYCWDSL